MVVEYDRPAQSPVGHFSVSGPGSGKLKHLPQQSSAKQQARVVTAAQYPVSRISVVSEMIRHIAREPAKLVGRRAQLSYLATNEEFFAKPWPAADSTSTTKISTAANGPALLTVDNSAAVIIYLQLD